MQMYVQDKDRRIRTLAIVLERRIPRATVHIVERQSDRSLQDQTRALRQVERARKRGEIGVRVAESGQEYEQVGVLAVGTGNICET
jgi:hypothetical protein